ncbi:MAG: hypothetical protein L6301_11155 [Desulfobacteraceae bacterium]|nr:hypothetical protein [Pseudomonadota bacterium]MCG2752393.1 hypothetical protein [Desulfobacteraceae bacterium]
MAGTPVTKSKVTKIIEELNQMVRSGQKDTLALVRYKHEAENLKKSGRFTVAFIIQGMVACLEKDWSKMHSSHKNAIHYSPDDPQATSNYAVSLANAHMLEDAIQYFIKTHEMEPTNTLFLDQVIGSLFDLSAKNNKYESELEFYAKRWKDLTGEPHSLYDDPEMTAKIIDSCDETINDKPSLATDVDSSIWDLAQSLVNGVE